MVLRHGTVYEALSSSKTHRPPASESPARLPPGVTNPPGDSYYLSTSRGRACSLQWPWSPSTLMILPVLNSGSPRQWARDLHAGKHETLALWWEKAGGGVGRFVQRKGYRKTSPPGKTWETWCEDEGRSPTESGVLWRKKTLSDSPYFVSICSEIKM